MLVHVVLGEEIVAENSRKYIETILGATPGDFDTGLVISSMGIGELGLNLFFEAPPGPPIIALRRALHENDGLRLELLGPDVHTAPSIFTYSIHRTYVEFVGERLVVTMLDSTRRVPMIRYCSGDTGRFLELTGHAIDRLQSLGVACDVLQQIPLIAISGRGRHVTVGKHNVYPEQIKEGLYLDPEMAELTTANFRLASEQGKARIRIQLAPDVAPTNEIRVGFERTISRYLPCPIRVECERYNHFTSGMSLDYERKFDYLGD